MHTQAHTGTHTYRKKNSMCGCGNDLCERTVSIMSITAASLLSCLSASLVYNCDWTTIQVDSCLYLFPYHCSLSPANTHISNVSPKCCISVQLQQLLTRTTNDRQQRGTQGSVKDHVIAGCYTTLYDTRFFIPLVHALSDTVFQKTKFT